MTSVMHFQGTVGCDAFGMEGASLSGVTSVSCFWSPFLGGRHDYSYVGVSAPSHIQSA